MSGDAATSPPTPPPQPEPRAHPDLAQTAAGVESIVRDAAKVERTFFSRLNPLNLLHALWRTAWASTLFRFSIYCAAVGLAMLVYAKATGPAAAPISAAPTPAPGPAHATRLIDDGAPATLRFGLSFAVGCLVAVLVRAFVKWTLFTAALLTAATFALHKLGLFDFDPAAVTSQIQAGTGWLTGKAENLRTLITGYLPSAGAAGFGAWVGIRRRLLRPDAFQA